jgi:transcriptional regulator with XRE-family HTH domain
MCDINAPGYSPDTLLNYCQLVVGVPSDMQLAKRMGITPPALSKVRHRRVGISSDLLLALHDVTGESLAELKRIAGIPKFIPFKPLHTELKDTHEQSE